MLGFHQKFCVLLVMKCITLLICLFSKWFFTVFSCNTLGIMKFHLLLLTSSKKKRDGREPSPLNKLYQIQRQVSCALSEWKECACLLAAVERDCTRLGLHRAGGPALLTTDTSRYSSTTSAPPQVRQAHTHRRWHTDTHTRRPLLIKTHNWLQTHLGYNCIWGPLTKGEHVKKSNDQPYPYSSRKTGSKSVGNNFSKW